MSQGREKEARKALQWLRGWVSPEAVQTELDSLITYVQKNQQDPTDDYHPVATTEGKMSWGRSKNNVAI